MSNPEDVFTRHPASAAFRDHTTEEAEALRDSMKLHGCDSSLPIIAVGKRIIIGWHRYVTARELGLKPQVVTKRLTAKQIHALVTKDELARRHMSPGDRADAVVELNLACGIKFAQKGDRSTPGAETPGDASRRPMTKRSVAAQVGVSKKTAERAINRVKGIMPNGADPAPTVDPSAEAITDLEAQLFRANDKIRDLEDEIRNIQQTVDSEDARKLMRTYTSQSELVRSLKASVGEWQHKHARVLKENQTIKRKIKALEKAKAG